MEQRAAQHPSDKFNAAVAKKGRPNKQPRRLRRGCLYDSKFPLTVDQLTAFVPLLRPFLGCHQFVSALV
jgi:hypothetical protein